MRYVYKCCQKLDSFLCDHSVCAHICIYTNAHGNTHTHVFIYINTSMRKPFGFP